MEIRVLRYFLAVAREGNITRAADVLHVTQPTLSRQLKDLEQELGKKLFIRSSHSVFLTDEGMLLRNRAEEIVNMVDKLEAEFSSMEETIGGDVYIGGGETEAMKHIARVAKDVQVRYPNIRYHLYSGNEEDITERLDKGLLDFGILIQPADISKYNYLNMPAKDVWGVVMRKDSPLALKESIQAGDLLNVPLICSRQAMKQTFSKNEFADWFGEDFHKLNIVTTYNLAYNAAIMVEEGIGYAITLDKIVNTSTASNLCFRPLQPRLESGLNIVWKKHHVLSAAANAFLKELQEEFAHTLN
ncbi:MULTISPECIES: LysR family transcriptional regulator [Priestia]|jgi:DNA-binding transcriptional LysR family regulator|uniref:Transcriptional regulator, LysR family n=4 Tax=Priestia TaxID=2800373 RepID=D5E2V0_PRIM1|nr:MULTISPECIES: LysR family transcriptional regulator [Priestia]AVX09666.1 LysR family transcriptional regulator [Bacillus sp. Y-01]KOP75781.1 LysR family transcriptional regulator [Bacillus sp. FJAT-21351]KQU22610.1 LysR family transcriptional regulator [Bacillus sp. Leaf75]MCJ7985127.1 LysR family transcriptional regulator [Priestia sp. OVL9]MDH6653257.1 DNA-binding transcriptional LysR family regulator [Bacillus sp. PvP124]MDP9576642.1 DNA-binding transcriptional LysR family regulator [Ba